MRCLPVRSTQNDFSSPASLIILLAKCRDFILTGRQSVASRQGSPRRHGPRGRVARTRSHLHPGFLEVACRNLSRGVGAQHDTGTDMDDEIDRHLDISGLPGFE